MQLYNKNEINDYMREAYNLGQQDLLIFIRESNNEKNNNKRLSKQQLEEAINDFTNLLNKYMSKHKYKYIFKKNSYLNYFLFHYTIGTLYITDIMHDINIKVIDEPMDMEDLKNNDKYFEIYNKRQKDIEKTFKNGTNKYSFCYYDFGYSTKGIIAFLK